MLSHVIPVCPTTLRIRMTESWVQSIINNMQLRIKNVHIRLHVGHEVGVERPFVVGLMWSSLSVSSTNEEGLQVFLTEVKEVMFKQLAISKLALYVDALKESHSEVCALLQQLMTQGQE